MLFSEVSFFDLTAPSSSSLVKIITPPVASCGCSHALTILGTFNRSFYATASSLTAAFLTIRRFCFLALNSRQYSWITHAA